jgi:ABC-2 type transport system permease protein
VFLFTIMLSLSVRNAVQTLFERGDIDLLLSSPLDTRVVLAARGAWVVVNSLMSLGVFMLPLTLAAVIFLGLRPLGVLVLMVAVALMTAGLGLLLTLALVRWLGARRARTVAQVVGVLLGAVFYLVTQLGRFIGRDSLPWLQNAYSSISSIPADSPLLFPARAALFEPLPTLLMLALGVAVYAISVQLTHRAFLTGATAGISGGRVKLGKNVKAARFQQNFFLNVVRKEWRLIFRDPMLISQTLLQLVYLIPTAFVFLGGGGSRGANLLGLVGLYPLLAFAAIFLGGSLAQNLTQVVVGAEDAPELLRMSPANALQVRWAKLLAAIAPAWALFTPLILWRATIEPKSLLIFLPFAAVTVLGGLMMLWHAKPFNRADLVKQRRGGQNWVIGLALLGLDIGWLGATLAPGWWGVSGAFVGLAVPLLSWLLARDNPKLGY